MVRAIPAGRLQELVNAATEVFIAQGYQRTQMEDVASALGVGKGTLYGYVESKAALFDAALRYADGREELPSTAALPLPTPPAGATATMVRARLADETRDLKLIAALTGELPRDGAAELATVIRDLYSRMSRNRRGIKLIDRCALDQPELAEAWFGAGRWAQHAALVSYLDGRIAAGLLRRVPSTPVAARMVLETIAFWAVHRHWDPSPQSVDEHAVQDAVVDLLLHGFARESS